MRLIPPAASAPDISAACASRRQALTLCRAGPLATATTVHAGQREVSPRWSPS